jgi:hypothetical protein
MTTLVTNVTMVAIDYDRQYQCQSALYLHATGDWHDILLRKIQMQSYCLILIDCLGPKP